MPSIAAFGAPNMRTSHDIDRRQARPKTRLQTLAQGRPVGLRMPGERRSPTPER